MDELADRLGIVRDAEGRRWRPARPPLTFPRPRCEVRSRRRAQGASRDRTFKVRLKQRRSSWRSVVLRGNQTLEDVHEAIFMAFERYDAHLYSFYFPSLPARRTASFKGHKEYTAPQGFHPLEGFEPDRSSASSETLDTLKFTAGQEFEYLFDFGDEWWHEIAVEAIGPRKVGDTNRRAARAFTAAVSGERGVTHAATAAHKPSLLTNADDFGRVRSRTPSRYLDQSRALACSNEWRYY